ncbi:ABC transporter ATP-binding protein [Cytophagaceae bacterium DM2B3-1]|uniref:ABC transporter ATP-binding protein n=1 Tax=Xanthocytophaga flava TaxID=3048013 RepID=A0ABT7CDK0_9BACT|nr:ABC transporter ATP-binding protein [Xanthocytophaga flavus]MDJ1491723.1 ABC transporter ATP-binding protein [Xanthocytophaga flavus]
MSVVVKVENVSKKYHLGKTGTNSLKGDIQRWWARKQGKEDPFSKVVEASQLQGEEFWALKDINFEIKQGDAVGIVGKNGAGKSTLLKILSRITLPTTGSIKVKGRIASLLEVGTGFNPDLSGRENVYLNGAILGMTKVEITRKFDEIVDFAGIERFIDTPVKRYSSGMYVRLAFAVAAHLESEILILDEVLAVGDAEFQKKCLGKMDDVAHKQGRTILFVSHSMASVKELCNTAIFLEKGKLLMHGPVQPIIDRYLKSETLSARTAERIFEDKPESAFYLKAARLLDKHMVINQNFNCDDPIIIELECQVNEQLGGLYGYLSVNRMDGTVVYVGDSREAGTSLDTLKPGRHIIWIQVPPRTLGAGSYSVYLNFTSTKNITGFHVDSPGHICTFELNDYTTLRGNNRGGYLSMVLPWQLQTEKIYAK